MVAAVTPVILKEFLNLQAAQLNYGTFKHMRQDPFHLNDKRLTNIRALSTH